MLKSIKNHSLLSSKAKSFIQNANLVKNDKNVIGRRQCLLIISNRSFCRASSPLLKEGPADYGYSDLDSRFDDKKHPTLEYAKLMPNRFSAMRHEQILQLCVEGSYNARREALIRNVMAIDSIEYNEAEKVVEQISAENKKGMRSEYLPYQVGMGVSVVASIVSFPMIFDLNTVSMFNDAFVTADAPDKKDLETFLEVGSWSWGWMEPIIGQVSFVLLSLQFARNQALNLGIKPYGDWMRNRRANKLVRAYPQYDEVFIRWYSEGQTMYGSKYLD